ncbi:MAG: hypothetical protein HC876_15350, partial [Chloroflexaceae bacterium]|nr:hypothetical protein [Chloroflexaceae bacterium]
MIEAQQVATVTNGGNLRTEPRIAADTVIAQVCPGDRLALREQQGDWVRVQIIELAADCAPDRVPPLAEGWLSTSLASQFVADVPPTPEPTPTAPPPPLEQALFETPLDGLEVPLVTSAIAPDGPLVAGGTVSGTVYLWGAESTPRYVLRGHTDWVRGLAFGPESFLLASASDDGTVRVWRTSDGSLLYNIAAHDDWVRAVAFSPDGSLLASAS